MPEAITPYNFVPLPEVIIPSEDQKPERDCPRDRYDKDRNTGWIDVSYETLTPLYTRAAEGKPSPVEFSEPVARTANGQTADFFHRGDQVPVLPGSSLRGMFRSTFEILTHSQMPYLTQKHLFFRSFAQGQKMSALYQRHHNKERLVAGLFKAGEDGYALSVSTRFPKQAPKGFVLVPAGAVLNYPGLPADVTRLHFSSWPVRVDIPDDPQMHNMLGVAKTNLVVKGGVKGFLVIPGRDVQQRRWYQVILDPSDSPAESAAKKCLDYPVESNVYHDYLAWGSMAHGRKFEEGNDRVPRKLEPGAPAFGLLNTDISSSEIKSIEVIGANMMMAVPYKNSMLDVAIRSYRNGEKPAEDLLDMADSVFGRVAAGSEKEDLTVKGRVFVEDALWVDDGSEPWHAAGNGVCVPDILSGPKPTAIQTYLNPKNGAFIHWNEPDARIRGFKRYWHRSWDAAKNALSNNQGALKATQSTLIQPVKRGAHFKGRIRFENLTCAELGALLDAVQLKPGLAHKFGMAKNLGLGSMKVTVSELTLRKHEEYYRSLAANGEGLDRSSGDKLATKLKELLEASDSYVNGVLAQEPGSSTWKDERIAAFQALYSWDDKPDDLKSRQVEIQNRANEANRELHNDNQWRNRYVLPLAVNVKSGKLDDSPVNSGGGIATAPPRVVQRPVGGNPGNQAAQPPRKGDKIKVTVVTTGGSGSVKLPDGRELGGIYIGGCDVGDTITVRVMDVGGDGKIRKVAR
jgi:CRISPR/Cas system CSM-associated protein Csm3 (group 7 of RAMP superfamily)